VDLLDGEADALGTTARVAVTAARPAASIRNLADNDEGRRTGGS
jgi:hypothetical protein